MLKYEQGQVGFNQHTDKNHSYYHSNDFEDFVDDFFLLNIDTYNLYSVFVCKFLKTFLCDITNIRTHDI